MVIALGHKIIDGPWGGGNSFAKSFVSYFSSRDRFVVIDSLSRDDIDFIIITDPRWWSPSVSFSLREVLYYKIFVNREVIVIHRINECDERKGTFFMNFLLRMANSLADHTVFISEWLKSLNVYSLPLEYSSVIRNGGDRELFKFSKTRLGYSKNELRLVTHHWGLHEKKGLKIYRYLDSLHGSILKGFLIRFTFIGSKKAKQYLPNCQVIGPLTDEELSGVLSDQDIYVTGSQNEPAGMHHIEGCLAGLPVLYQKGGGGIREYCHGFGLEYSDVDDILDQMFFLVEKYSLFKERLRHYPFDSDYMNYEYLKLMFRLKNSKKSNAGLWSIFALRKWVYICVIIFAPR